MAKAKKQPNGKWRLRSYVGTDSSGRKVFQSFTCDTEAACYKAEKAWLKAGGGTIIEEKPKVTVDSVLEDYIESCRNSKRKTYSPSTIREYESSRENAFALIKDMDIHELTIDDVQDLVDARSAAGRSTKTIKNAIYLLKPALEKADVMLNFRQLELPEQEAEDYIIPTDEEIQKLLEATKEKDPQMYMAIVLGAFCGCRRSEIAALEKQDVDQKEMEIHITKAVVSDEIGCYVQKETKTKAGKRDIDITPEVLECLRIREKADGVIYAPNTSLVGLTPDVITGRFVALKKRLGFKFCFHGLRHYYASVMVALDIPKKYAAEAMGHSDYTMIEKVYGQVIREKEKAVASAIGAHTRTVLGGGTFQY